MFCHNDRARFHWTELIEGSRLCLYLEILALILSVSAICHLPSAICHLPSAICHLPSAICQLPAVSTFAVEVLRPYEAATQV
jgi:hypothetical protein